MKTTTTLSTPSPITVSSETLAQFFGDWVQDQTYPKLKPEDYIAMLSSCPKLWRGGQRVLDVGCGVGFVAQFVKARGNEVVGLDLSEPALQQAMKAGAIDSMVVADYRRTGLPDKSFDVVLCFMSMMYAFELREILGEFARVLKPDGAILIVDHNPLSPYVLAHFHRPDIVDRLVEGKSNLPRRYLTLKNLRDDGWGFLQWDTARYYSAFTWHPNRLINVVHDFARLFFKLTRFFTKAPWTCNVFSIVGRLEPTAGSR